MVDYLNFYENADEVNRRLRGTVVLYDGKPYYVMTLAMASVDSIVRLYLEPLSSEHRPLLLDNYKMKALTDKGISFPWQQYPHGSSSMISAMETFTKQVPELGILRKKINSPSFNKFRPFPLGYSLQDGGYPVYVMRKPVRKGYQGFSSARAAVINLDAVDGYFNSGNFDINSPALYNAIVADWPTYHAAVGKMLQNPSQLGQPFHRDLAIIRGPCDSFFLGHRYQIVGQITDLPTGSIRLAKSCQHLFETLSEMNIFQSIATQ